ncbi:MAG: hypothetical protein ACLGIM_14850 [Alphaproteobacteria bacterium]|jgi:subtilase family serine protease
MTHKPHVPSASVSPYPLHPEPIRDRAPNVANASNVDSRVQTSTIVKGAAIGIGSAAIVAALMYIRRR